jgi:hypothetical protein
MFSDFCSMRSRSLAELASRKFPGFAAMKVALALAVHERSNILPHDDMKVS